MRGKAHEPGQEGSCWKAKVKGFSRCRVHRSSDCCAGLGFDLSEPDITHK